MKRTISLVALALMLVILCGAATSCSLLGGNAFVETKNDLFYEYDPKYEETYIYSNGELSSFILDGQVLKKDSSLGCKTGTFLMYDATLYAIQGDKLFLVDEDVCLSTVSADGSAIAYTTTYGELMLYTLSEKKSVMIADDLAATVLAFVISPDGKTVAYSDNSDEDEVELVVWNDGKKKTFGEDMYPVGVSNGAKQLYYYEYDRGILYVNSEKNGDVKLLSGIENYYSVMLYFNCDYTEALFTDGEKTYICIDGNEKEKLSSSKIGLLCPHGSSSYYSVMPTQSYLPACITDSKSFIGKHYLAEGDLYYIGKDCKADKIDSDVMAATLSNDGSKLYYLTDNNVLYRGKVGSDEYESVAKKVRSYVATKNGDACYYLDESGSLKYINKAGEANKVANDVYSVAMTKDDYLLYITDYTSSDGGVLYSVRDGEEKERIADDVYELVSTPVASYYRINYKKEYEIYGAKSKNSFRLITEVTKNY